VENFLKEVLLSTLRPHSLSNAL